MALRAAKAAGPPICNIMQTDLPRLQCSDINKSSTVETRLGSAPAHPKHRLRRLRADHCLLLGPVGQVVGQVLHPVPGGVGGACGLIRNDRSSNSSSSRTQAGERIGWRVVAVKLSQYPMLYVSD